MSDFGKGLCIYIHILNLDMENHYISEEEFNLQVNFEVAKYYF